MRSGARASASAIAPRNVSSQVTSHVFCSTSTYRRALTSDGKALLAASANSRKPASGSSVTNFAVAPAAGSPQENGQSCSSMGPGGRDASLSNIPRIRTSRTSLLHPCFIPRIPRIPHIPTSPTSCPHPLHPCNIPHIRNTSSTSPPRDIPSVPPPPCRPRSLRAASDKPPFVPRLLNTCARTCWWMCSNS